MEVRPGFQIGGRISAMSNRHRYKWGGKLLHMRVQQASPEERQRLWPRVVAYRAGHESYQERTPYPLPLVIFSPEETF